MKISNLNEFKRNSSLVIRKIEGSFFFLVGQDAFEANEIGAIIVNLAGRDMSIEDLHLKISRKYSFNDLEQIRDDVNEYLEFLTNEGILLYE